MEPCTVAFKLERDRVRLGLMRGEDELLRACLPPPSRLQSCKAARALLESLATWLDVRLRVVWCAGDPGDASALGLTDELGTGLRTVFYEVEAIARRHRRPARLRGVGDFRDVRQLCLLDAVTGGRCRLGTEVVHPPRSTTAFARTSDDRRGRASRSTCYLSI